MSIGSPPQQVEDGLAAARVVDGHKVYGSGETEVRALDGVTVDFDEGRFTAIMGPSGSGKSTLMHCAAGLDNLTSGRTYIGDVELGSLSENDLTLLRRDRVGFVFQFFNLLPTLTASAVARALVSKPEIVFADEPTGNLDSHTGGEVLDFLRRAVDELGQTVVIVTHEAGAAARADRVLFLADGRIVEQLIDPTADTILDRIKELGG